MEAFSHTILLLFLAATTIARDEENLIMMGWRFWKVI
jgi:hypothetical protein